MAILSRRAVAISIGIPILGNPTASGLLYVGAGGVLASGPATTDGSGNIKTTGVVNVGGVVTLNNDVIAAVGKIGSWAASSSSSTTLALNSTASAAYIDTTGTGAASGQDVVFRYNDTTEIGRIKTTSAFSFNTANLLLGAAAVDTAPVAQTLSVQNTLPGGTSNVAGANFTLAGSQGKGTGVGGDVGIQYAPAGSTGTTVNALADGIRLKGTGSVVLNNAAVATNATDGFLYIATSAGTPTGTPTGFTGRVALVYDTTNHQFWIYDGAWKQPKTPAGAALVTWQ